MRRLCVLGLALLCGLVAAGTALALPHLDKAQSDEVSTLVNRFVNDVVRRRNLADGWTIAAPEVRGGTTRAASGPRHRGPRIDGNWLLGGLIGILVVFVAAPIAISLRVRSRNRRARARYAAAQPAVVDSRPGDQPGADRHLEP